MADLDLDLDELTDDDEEEPFDEPIEAGSPTLENAVFVLLGIITTLAVIFDLIRALTG